MLCSSKFCCGEGKDRYGGLCGSCWVKLSQAKRDILVPPKSASVIQPVIRVINPPNHLLLMVLILWGLVVTGAVIFLLLR